MNPFIFVVVAFWTSPEDGSLVMKQMKHYRDIGSCQKAAKILEQNMQGVDNFKYSVCLRSREYKL